MRKLFSKWFLFEANNVTALNEQTNKPENFKLTFYNEITCIVVRVDPDSFVL